MSVGCDPPKMHLLSALPPNERDEPLLALLFVLLLTALLKETKALSGEKEKVFPLELVWKAFTEVRRELEQGPPKGVPRAKLSSVKKLLSEVGLPL